jgi:opacity protein-like surface antigen
MKKLALVGAVASIFSVGFLSAADGVVSEEGAEAVGCSSCSFDGAYFGLGLGGSFVKSKFKSEVKVNGNELNRKVKKSGFMCTAVFGGGKAFKGKFYVGAEGLIDFAKTKNTDDMKIRGIVPGVGLRFGYVNNCCMIYFKPAISFQKTTLKKIDRTEGADHWVSDEASVSKAAYSVALGAEKSFCKKFNARLEGEYVFKSKKDIKITNGANTGVLKLKCNEGFNLRALCSYNVKFS